MVKIKKYSIVGLVILIIIIAGLFLYNFTQQDIPAEYNKKPVINSESDSRKVINDIDASVNDSLSLLGDLKDSLS